MVGNRPAMRLLRIPGVYGPCRDSELLAEAIPDWVRPGDRVIDPFTGSGILALTTARAGASEVWAVDVSRRAVAAARINARLNGLGVLARRGNLFEPAGSRRFDLVVANPPYVPSISDAPGRGPARAWEAGPDGRMYLDRLLRALPGRLRQGGRVMIVQSSLCGVDRTCEMLEDAGLQPTTVACETAPLGPITAPRAEELERRGVLSPGQRTEDTVVICGASATPATVPADAVAALSTT
jgi:release factor glutamine methyltransferase